MKNFLIFFAVIFCAVFSYLLWQAIYMSGSMGTECSIKGVKENLFATFSEERYVEKCKYLDVYFPKDLASEPFRVYVPESARLEIYKNEQLSARFSLEIGRAREKEDYRVVGACLPDDLVVGAVVVVSYAEGWKQKPVLGDLMPVSFCREEIVIDNLEELLEQSKQQKKTGEE